MKLENFISRYFDKFVKILNQSQYQKKKDYRFICIIKKYKFEKHNSRFWQWR